MTDLATQIGKLLNADPFGPVACTQATINAIAALVSPPPPEAVKGLVERLTRLYATLAAQSKSYDVDALPAAIAELRSYAADVERLREQLDAANRGEWIDPGLAASAGKPMNVLEAATNAPRRFNPALTKGGDRG